MNRDLVAKNMLFPFELSAIMFGIVLLVVVLDRQPKIVVENKENELFSIARTIALTVEIALEHERLEALAELNTLLQGGAHISVAGIFVDKGDSFELLAGYPSEGDAELAAGVDPIKFLVASAPFGSRNLNGYIEVGFNREQFASQLQQINLILYIAFIAILILQMIVYRIVQLVRRQQERERKEATAQIIQSSKLATLGEMSTSVAHELNQPLNVIRMAAGNIRRRISKGTSDPEYLNGKLIRVEGQVARAAAIIDHMRMFGRVSLEDPIPIDSRTVVMNALDLTGAQLRMDGIEMVIELAEGGLFILGYAIQMEQVILNLLSNARDAMDGRDIKKITVRVFGGHEDAHIILEDTGGGIPRDVLPHIFEPFYTTKEVGKGPSLGLSVSYDIIHDMNGAIVAKNIDDGARFTITLPSVSW
jgi:signal transduction histidine kinase